jgi:hypothetical protein
MSGNVLSGPTHGLLASVASLRAALAHVDACDVDALGGVLGLAMLAVRRRNVATKSMRCAYEAPDVAPPPCLWPAADPYV